MWYSCCIWGSGCATVLWGSEIHNVLLNLQFSFLEVSTFSGGEGSSHDSEDVLERMWAMLAVISVAIGMAQ